MPPTTHEPAPSPPQAMPDVQGSADTRRVAIDKVGVKDIRYPISLHCPPRKSADRQGDTSKGDA
ncbi:MAG: hypothetical protein GVY24_01765, partial [Planctomycetes bacterium]|nr:hypothetical protein [Planctomycetota bacterium]